MEEFIITPKNKVVVLRHDSDIWPKNDLKMAHIENELKVRSSYYFRVPETFNKEIILKIVGLSHEIGYHYEDLVRSKGNQDRAIANFKINLNQLRRFYPVKTITRHGRPLSSIESLKLWEEYNYKSLGIKAEPYLDVDYSKVLYLTDNGSKWNASSSNIRDYTYSEYFNFDIETTFDLIEAFSQNKLPNQIILNVHPARWNDNFLVWTYRFFLQKAKNSAKTLLKSLRK
ncbi:MAG: hypothetical protein K9G31_08225 [Crocinitomicaceae bacterium]|nr:hypothetical protein [Crocinitomicaceae bacterium]MCF8443599.1 hypothetical protein [Crocinitomicaceae bacterium]